LLEGSREVDRGLAGLELGVCEAVGVGEALLDGGVVLAGNEVLHMALLDYFAEGLA